MFGALSADPAAATTESVNIAATTAKQTGQREINLGFFI